MTFLLDVNLLIALIDPQHVANSLAQSWFSEHSTQGWATCPLTENGAVRIVSGSRYPNSTNSPLIVVNILRMLRDLPGHVFWGDEISLVASDLVDPVRLTTSHQITDAYLLALAVSRGGKLATLDRRLVASAVKGGAEALHIIS